MSAQQQPIRVWDGVGQAGPFVWYQSTRKHGQWTIAVHITQVVPGHDDVIYESCSGVAADDGFGNLVLIGGLQ